MSRPLAPLAIAGATDLLLTLTLFHHLIRWWTYPSWPAPVLGGVAILVVVNDLLTARSTYEIYSTDIFFVDLCIIFVLNGVPSVLTKQDPRIATGLFWLLLGICEALYTAWDIILGSRAKEQGDEPGRSRFTKWVAASILASALYTTTAISHIWQLLPSAVNMFMSACAAIYVLTLLGIWNFGRYRRNKEANLSFLD